MNISYDAYPLNENLASLDRSLMNKFIKKAASTGRVHLQDDLMTNLTKLKMIQNGRPALAAMLLFGNHGYSIHMGRFKAADTIIDDILIKEPLVIALDEAMLFIKKHINLSYEFDGSLQRKERWQYPLEVIRELLLNAVVHRDYKNTSDIVIKIFDDRIIFSNPGNIYGSLTIEDLKRDDYVSSIRNKLLAEAYYLTGDIEKYGTGYVRIRSILKYFPEALFNPSEIGDFFQVELTASSTKIERLHEKLHEKLHENLSELQKNIIVSMSKDPKITHTQLSAILGKSREAIRKNINKLKKMGIIRRFGPDKGGCWQVTLQENNGKKQ